MCHGRREQTSLQLSTAKWGCEKAREAGGSHQLRSLKGGAGASGPTSGATPLPSLQFSEMSWSKSRWSSVRLELLSSGRRAQSLADKQRNPRPCSRGGSPCASFAGPLVKEPATRAAAIFRTQDHREILPGYSPLPRANSGNACLKPEPEVRGVLRIQNGSSDQSPVKVYEKLCGRLFRRRPLLEP